MKLSAIVLGLAAASAFAQAAPAAAPAATPAAQPAAEAPKAEAAQQAAASAADQKAVAAEEAKKAEEAKAAEEAKKAEEAKAAEEAKKAEEAKAAEEAKKAEEAKAAEEAKKAEEAKAAEEAKKAEEAKAAEEAKKAEEAKAAEEAKKAEETKAAQATEEKKTEAAGASFVERLNITKADAAPEEKKAMEFKVSGAAEFDAYASMTTGDDKTLYHDYWSTLDVDFQVKFNEQWSAQVELEADGASTNPGAIYNGAFVQYTQGENLTVKFGDLTFSEGAFNYYDYDDPAVYAAGMKEHDIRGLELDLYGLQLGLGFTRGDDDDGKSYDAHVAYQFDFAGQALRPFAHYRSLQESKANELHAGLEAALEFGPFAIHAVYGLHADRLTDDNKKATHAFLAEPSFKVANVNIKAGFFYAYFNDNMAKATIHGYEIPEYMFAYGEGDIKLNDVITVGLLGELHTNSLDKDTDLGSLNFGTRIYFTPVDGLDVTGFAMAILPMGDDWEKAGHEDKVAPPDRQYGEDVNLKFGVETVFSF